MKILNKLKCWWYGRHDFGESIKFFNKSWDTWEEFKFCKRCDAAEMITCCGWLEVDTEFAKEFIKEKST